VLRGAENNIFTDPREDRDMSRPLSPIPLLCAILLAGCGAPAIEPMGAVAGVTVASIPVLQRTPLDAAVSVVTGWDCSLVRWDRGLSYCRQEEPPPAPPPFCSRSLGQVDCWREPDKLSNRPRELADGPRSLTLAQEAHRTRRWPVF